MPNYNVVILMGHLTRNPELLYGANGTPICKFGLAVNHRYGVGEEKKEEVCFIDVTAFNKQAEFVTQFFTKGHCVIVTGRLVFEQWETEDGQKRSKHAIVAEKVGFGESKKESNG